MSVLQNKDNSKLNKGRDAVYEIPAVIREEKEDISFYKAFIISFLLHPLIVIFVILVSLILRYLGLHFDLFKKPDLKPKDIEFVLVEKEAPPINKNTKNRSDKNSQAGGKHDPTRKESLPQPAAKKAENKTATPNVPAKKPATPKPQVQKPQQKPQQQIAPKQEQKVTQTPAPKAPAPKPTPAPAAPKVTQKPNSTFNIPVPKSSIPQVAQPTAPLTPAPKIGGGGTTTGVNGGTGSSPAPTFSQSSASSTRGGMTGGSGRFSAASGYGSGNVGNPSPGNPNGAPGIDAIKEPDFGPYMKELQRRIKMNWDPPKGNESKRVVLLFTISRDGRLMSVKVYRSSGLQTADNAAVNAVKLTAPFRPLPPEFRGNSVDIQFTFDYNVLGASLN
ncbi:TonB C-terminal domain-containing protein [bacterium]|nr:TonB C-terminal domain-containing protein [bacterium]